MTKDNETIAFMLLRIIHADGSTTVHVGSLPPSRASVATIRKRLATMRRTSHEYVAVSAV